MWDHLLPNLLAAVGTQLGSARAHDVVGRGDIGLVASAGIVVSELFFESEGNGQLTCSHQASTAGPDDDTPSS